MSHWRLSIRRVTFLLQLLPWHAQGCIGGSGKLMFRVAVTGIFSSIGAGL